MAKYNLTEKKEKDPKYRTLIKAELVDELSDKIMQKMIVEKKFRDPDYSARQLAEDLGTNTRYISAVVSLRFQQNYASLVNEYRIREACYLLVDKRYMDKTLEEIAYQVGFTNRQSFYAAFYKQMHITPREYRVAHTSAETKKTKKSKK